MRNSRKRVISDKIFAKLWKEAEKTDEKKIFINTYASVTSNKYIDFKKKAGLEYEETLSMLNEIYNKQHMSFKDIINSANKKKSEISNIFCIPIRTVEDWYNGKNKCPSYIRLMILRQFHLLNLGKYIYLESDEEYIKSKPEVYKKRIK